MKRLVTVLSLSFTTLFGLEMQPWFGDVYEFHLLSSYSYSWFNSVQNSSPPFHQFFQTNLAYFDLDFSPSPVWSIDADLQLAQSSAVSFTFRSAAIQARYLWLDDIVGDPVSFSTGASVRATGTSSLKDVSCPSHGNADFEIHFSLGKEFDANDTWRFRTWCFGAVGQANRGAPWVRGVVAFEMNIDDLHRWALYAEGINGYGRHTHIDVDDFFGYAKKREKVIDLTLRYGRSLGVWGTLRLGYSYRVLAKTAPERVNTVFLSYLLPFSL
jgi:hypothetical protein